MVCINDDNNYTFNSKLYVNTAKLTMCNVFAIKNIYILNVVTFWGWDLRRTNTVNVLW